MKNLYMIACVSRDGGLGKDGKLLWQIPADMQFFREATLGHPVIMGRKTFASIGRALPGRKNLVLSRQKGTDQTVQWCDEMELWAWLKTTVEPKFIIGGASLYQKFLPEAEIIYLTEVDGIKPTDTYFPKFDKSQFERTVLKEGTDADCNYQIVKYVRKDAAC